VIPEEGKAMERVTMKIDGMTCGHCVSAVRAALAELPGVDVQEVAIGSATVAYDPTQSTPREMAEAVRDAGYEPADA
jgi:copper chaperone CopZ